MINISMMNNDTKPQHFIEQDRIIQLLNRKLCIRTFLNLCLLSFTGNKKITDHEGLLKLTTSLKIIITLITLHSVITHEVNPICIYVLQI